MPSSAIKNDMPHGHEQSDNKKAVCAPKMIPTWPLKPATGENTYFGSCSLLVGTVKPP